MPTGLTNYRREPYLIPVSLVNVKVAKLEFHFTPSAPYPGPRCAMLFCNALLLAWYAVASFANLDVYLRFIGEGF
jgi:hypothetical protein